MKMVEEGHNQPKISPKSIKFQETMENGEEDRISELPDCLLIDILSRLPSTKYAIRTGALSKRWKHLWTLVPTLIFKHCDDNVPWSDFASFVDKTLSQRGQLKLKKFKLCIRCYFRSVSQAQNWVGYARRCNVEELNLILPWMDDFFVLEEFFINNACFTDLTLDGCMFNALGAVSWKKLKRLCFYRMLFLSDNLFEKILSGSPLLETLVLDNCLGFKRLDITSKSVKNLVVGDCIELVEIKAPNILSLTIKGVMWLQKLLLVNVSSLVEANLDYTHENDETKPKEEEEEEILKRLILNLFHVKDLRIGFFCSKVLSRLEAKGFIIPSNLKISDGFYERVEHSDWSDSDSDSVESRDSDGFYERLEFGDA